MKERTKTSNWMVDHFSSTFFNLSLAWMLYFHVWLQNNRGNSKFGENTILIMAYIKRSHVSLLEQWQNLNNPEGYLELGQTSKIECFAKIVSS